MIKFNSLQDEIDFFAPNPDLRAKIVDVDGEKIVIIDDFYKNPHQIRELALQSPRTRNPKFLHGLPGSRVEMAFYFGHLAQAFHRLISDVYTDDMAMMDPSYVYDCLNHSRFLVNIQNSDLPPRVPHVDSNRHGGFVAGIYLNTPEECSGGTAFYKFKGSKYVDLDNLDTDLMKYTNYILDSDGEHWEKLYLAEMKFNRLVLYRQRVLHTPYILPHTYTDETPRLIQMFFI